VQHCLVGSEMCIRDSRWGNHCFGCTAGQGSSCAGATA
jgi:hypothetical protein